MLFVIGQSDDFGFGFTTINRPFPSSLVPHIPNRTFLVLVGETKRSSLICRRSVPKGTIRYSQKPITLLGDRLLV